MALARAWGTVLPVLAAAAATLPAAAGPDAGAPPDLVIRNVHVVDLEAGRTLRDRRIVIAGDRIVAVARERGSPPRAATVVDGRGAWVIPGLWDMHAHLTFYPGMDTEDVPAATLPLYVAHGVLGVRDMGSPRLADLVALRGEIEAGHRIGPRLVVTGRQLDGPAATDWTKRSVPDAAEGRQAVRDLKAAGADFVKAYDRLPRAAYLAIADECRALGLPLAGHLPLAVAPHEAVAAGQRSIEHMGPARLRDASYGYLPEGAAAPPDRDPGQTAALRQAIDAALGGAAGDGFWTRSTLTWLQSVQGRGALATVAREFGAVESVEVLRREPAAGGTDVCVRARHERGERTYKFLVADRGEVEWLPDEPDVLAPGRVRELARLLAGHEVWVTPTLAALYAIAARETLLARGDPRLAYVGAEVRRQLDPRNDPRYASWTPLEWGWARRAYDRDARLAVTLHRAGVRIMTGTDAVTDWCLPGFGLHDELALLVAAGFTPLAALRAATVEPAAYLGRSADLGTVAAGKLADLVLVAGDPLADVRQAAAVRGVVRAGRWLDRAALDRLLEGVRQLVTRE